MINKQVPDIPSDVLPTSINEMPSDFYEEIRNLWFAILKELENPEYRGRSHQNTGTHDAGCRGPLCKKSYREHPRRKTNAGFSGYTPREERVYDPIIEYFHTVAKFRIKNYKLEVYKELTE